MATYSTAWSARAAIGGEKWERASYLGRQALIRLAIEQGEIRPLYDRAACCGPYAWEVPSLNGGAGARGVYHYVLPDGTEDSIEARSLTTAKQILRRDLGRKRLPKGVTWH